MTDASSQNTLTEVLVRHGIYSHNGILRIAIMDNTLQDLITTNTFQVNPDEVTLVEAPGTTEWVDHMARTRRVLNRRADDVENSLRVKSEYIETLGQALLEEAERRDWCSEYDDFAREWDLPLRLQECDDFAREWDLPLRLQEYDVTVSVRVKASDLDEAQTLVCGEVNLSSYSHDWVVDGPGYSVDTAY